MNENELIDRLVEINLLSEDFMVTKFLDKLIEQIEIEGVGKET